ncbi:MAG: GNAT family N-acetyltransferase [Proteobacteria bacterium]|nr:GNAT family N-acetyltransferase [Pseudomonadota bacterium]
MSPTDAPESSGDYPRWIATLRNRRNVLIRPIRKRDLTAARAFFDGLSREARRHRFMRPQDAAEETPAESLVDARRPGEIAYVAVVKEDSRQKVVGVGQCVRDTMDGCRCTVVVADAWYDRGLGSALLKRLIATARRDGIARMYFIGYAENLRLRDLARFFGFDLRQEPDHPRRVVYELALTTDPVAEPADRPDRDDAVRAAGSVGKQ